LLAFIKDLAREHGLKVHWLQDKVGAIFVDPENPDVRFTSTWVSPRPTPQMVKAQILYQLRRARG
jgi:hypothetical protein